MDWWSSYRILKPLYGFMSLQVLPPNNLSELISDCQISRKQPPNLSSFVSSLLFGRSKYFKMLEESSAVWKLSSFGQAFLPFSPVREDFHLIWRFDWAILIFDSSPAAMRWFDFLNVRPVRTLNKRYSTEYQHPRSSYTMFNSFVEWSHVSYIV